MIAVEDVRNMRYGDVEFAHTSTSLELDMVLLERKNVFQFLSGRALSEVTLNKRTA